MRYVQTLRMLNGLKWLAIVLVAIYALVVGIAAATGFLGHVQHITDKDFTIPLPALFAISAFVACIVITRFGRTLASENDEHLPVTWTRPASRMRTALTILGVDALGIVAAFAMTLALSLAFVATFQVTHYLLAPADVFAQLLRYLVQPFAWYALLMALTASVEGGAAICGWAWVSAVFLETLATAPVFPAAWHTLFGVLDFLNPLAFGSYHTTTGHDAVNVLAGPAPTLTAALTPGMDVVALGALFVVALVVGLAQWQRLET